MTDDYEPDDGLPEARQAQAEQEYYEGTQGLVEFRITFRAEDLVELSRPATWELGYVTVLAPDETAARNLIHDLVGEAWHLIDQGPFADFWSDYPSGELERWTTTEPTQVGS